jgi:hypothetical protein
MDCDEIKTRISKMQILLNNIVLSEDLQDEQVLKISRELDDLINDFYLICAKKNNMTGD